MILTSLDLEMNQPSNKIISIGYCIGGVYHKENKVERDIFVKIDEPLNPAIVELTGITDEKLQAEGVSLQEAYQILKADHIKYKSFINPLTWGGGDSELLRIQLGKTKDRWIFGRRWIDCKTLFISDCLANKKKFKGGLAKSMTSLGLVFNGKAHSSKDDAINTLDMYRELLRRIQQ